MKKAPIMFQVEDLFAKYRFLRKIGRENVVFDLLCHPYWICLAHGFAKGLWFSGRKLNHVLTCDAFTARMYLLHTLPDWEEYEGQGAAQQEDFAPVVHDEEAVRLLFARKALEDWKRKHCRVWRPRVDVSLEDMDCTLMYKRYWLMRPVAENALSESELAARPTQEKSQSVFIFDASTGMGGTSEFRPVMEYWWKRQEVEAWNVTDK